MYLPVPNQLKIGEEYYVLKVPSDPLLSLEERDYSVETYTAILVRPLVCYGKNGTTTKIHSLNAIHRNKLQALVELKQLYEEKRELLFAKVTAVDEVIEEIKKELPDVR